MLKRNDVLGVLYFRLLVVALLVLCASSCEVRQHEAKNESKSDIAAVSDAHEWYKIHIYNVEPSDREADIQTDIGLLVYGDATSASFTIPSKNIKPIPASAAECMEQFLSSALTEDEKLYGALCATINERDVNGAVLPSYEPDSRRIAFPIMTEIGRASCRERV